MQLLQKDEIKYYKLSSSNNKNNACLITFVDKSFTAQSDEGPYFKYTHEHMKRYSKKYGLDYIIVVADEYTDFESFMYEKFKVKKIAKDYDRIIYTDADVLFRKSARNILDIVPKNQIGAFKESDISPYPKEYYPKYLAEYKKEREKLNTFLDFEIPDCSLDFDFYNMGFLVLNNYHMSMLFVEPEVKLTLKNCYCEQSYLNLRIFQKKFTVFDIGKEFSGWFSKSISREQNFDLYLGCDIIHFAGKSKEKTKIERIYEFLELERTTKYTKPKRFVFFKDLKYYSQQEREFVARERDKNYSIRSSDTSHLRFHGIVELLKHFLDIENKIAVELYSKTGEVSEIIASKFEKVFCIDEFKGSMFDKPIEKLFNENTKGLNNVYKIKERSYIACNLFEDESLDFVYINDLKLDYEEISSDIVLWFQKIRPGGYIAGHGYMNSLNSETIVKAVTEKFGRADVLFEDSSWMVRKRDQFIPLVTVAIAAYNTDCFLEECLDSVLKQTYQNFEVVIIDDGSIDNTPRILEKYRSKDKRIRVFRNFRNRGCSASRNLITDNSIGEYILPFDSDNILEPHALETYVKTMNETGADVVYCNIKNFGEDDKTWITPDKITLEKMLDFNQLDHCSLVRRKDLYKFRYDEKLPGYVDWDLFLRMIAEGRKFVKVNDSLFRYRKRIGSISYKINKDNKNIKNYITNKITVNNVKEIKSRNVTNPKITVNNVKEIKSRNVTNPKITTINKTEEKLPFYDEEMFLLENERTGKVWLFKNEFDTKYCLITLVDSEYTKKAGGYFGLTHENFKKYCKKYHLNYYILVGKEGLTIPMLFYEKFRLVNFFDKHDRILYVDADVLIRDNSSNIFEVVPEDSLGMQEESETAQPYDNFLRNWLNEYKRQYEIKYQQTLIIPKWNGELYNAGTMVIPKKYSYIFSEPDIFIHSVISEQSWINYQIMKDNINVYNIGRKFSGLLTRTSKLETETNLDLFRACDMIHFTYSNKISRMKKLIEFEKTTHPIPKKIILSKKPEEYDEYFRELHNKNREEYTKDSIRGLIELCEYLDCKRETMVEVNNNTRSRTDSVLIFSKFFDKVYSINKEIKREALNVIYTDKSIYKEIEDNSLDFVYIDNDNSYAKTCSDITLWFQKVKPGGYMGGHDFSRPINNETLVKAILERFENIDVMFDDGSWIVKKENQIIPLVSLIVIDKFLDDQQLKKCLETLTKQSFQNFELIFVYYKENNLKILDDYLNKFKKIVKIKANNTDSLGKSKNQALDKCIGEYILILDLPYELKTDSIRLFVNKLEENDNDVVYCNANFIDSKGNIQFYKARESFTINDLKSENQIKGTAMFRREVWHDNRFSEDNKFEKLENWIFWVCNMLKSSKFVKLDSDLYFCSTDMLKNELDNKKMSVKIYISSLDKQLKQKSNKSNAPKTISKSKPIVSNVLLTRLYKNK